MANNLLQNLRNRLTSGSNTEAARNIAQASTGRAVGPGAAPAPQLDISAEQAAAAAPQAQQRQFQLQQRAAETQLKEQEQVQTQKLSLQAYDVDQKRLNIREDSLQKAITIFDRYSDNLQELNLKRQTADMEQLAFNIRMQNDTYINKIQIEAKKMQLQDQFLFETELTRAIFGEYYDLALKDVEVKELLDSNKREFETEMGMLEYDFKSWARDLEQKSKMERAKWEAASKVFGAAVEGGMDIASARASSGKTSTPSSTPTTSVSA